MKERVAVVTGASRGIGKAIAQQLHNQGFQVVGISRQMEAAPHIALPIKSDISYVYDHRNIVERVADHYGRVDILVNNAGMAPRKREDILISSHESFDELIDVNLRGPFFLTQAFVNFMLKTTQPESGTNRCIIFITSVSAVSSSPERPEYCISKAGLSMASQLYADRLKDTDIAVHEIRPGIIATDMTAPVKDKYDKQIANGLIPMGRWGQPDDIAKVVVSLANGAIPYATGSVIEVSGGMNIRHL